MEYVPFGRITNYIEKEAWHPAYLFMFNHVKVYIEKFRHDGYDTDNDALYDARDAKVESLRDSTGESLYAFLQSPPDDSSFTKAYSDTNVGGIDNMHLSSVFKDAWAQYFPGFIRQFDALEHQFPWEAVYEDGSSFLTSGNAEVMPYVVASVGIGNIPLRRLVYSSELIKQFLPELNIRGQRFTTGEFVGELEKARDAHKINTTVFRGDSQLITGNMIGVGLGGSVQIPLINKFPKLDKYVNMLAKVGNSSLDHNQSTNGYLRQFSTLSGDNTSYPTPSAEELKGLNGKINIFCITPALAMKLGYGKGWDGTLAFFGPFKSILDIVGINAAVDIFKDPGVWNKMKDGAEGLTRAAVTLTPGTNLYPYLEYMFSAIANSIGHIWLSNFSKGPGIGLGGSVSILAS